MKSTVQITVLCTGLALTSTACKQARQQSSLATEAAPSRAEPQSPPARSAAAKQPAPSPQDMAVAGSAWSFDADRSGELPAGFSFGLTGSGARGRWEIKADPGAPSGGQVLAQLDADDTDFRFPIAVAETVQGADVRVSVRCKMVSGRVDQACGLVTRYLDENNYYITRANALEGNIRLYYVKDGKRRQLASWSGEVKAGVWHDYTFDAQGDRLQVSWNGARIIDHRDTTFSQGGRIGVWTKADSVTYFDDLRVGSP